uniref:Uncharacterized protein n=1 Tax=Meloidogyne javanica TaxID=6303 RepID=A0A915ME59_MELJA
MSPRENINSNNKQHEEAKKAADEMKIAARLNGIDAKTKEDAQKNLNCSNGKCILSYIDAGIYYKDNIKKSGKIDEKKKLLDKANKENEDFKLKNDELSEVILANDEVIEKHKLDKELLKKEKDEIQKELTKVSDENNKKEEALSEYLNLNSSLTSEVARLGLIEHEKKELEVLLEAKDSEKKEVENRASDLFIKVEESQHAIDDFEQEKAKLEKEVSSKNDTIKYLERTVAWHRDLNVKLTREKDELLGTIMRLQNKQPDESTSDPGVGNWIESNRNSKSSPRCSSDRQTPPKRLHDGTLKTKSASCDRDEIAVKPTEQAGTSAFIRNVKQEILYDVEPDSFKPPSLPNTANLGAKKNAENEDAYSEFSEPPRVVRKTSDTPVDMQSFGVYADALLKMFQARNEGSKTSSSKSDGNTDESELNAARALVDSLIPAFEQFLTSNINKFIKKGTNIDAIIDNFLQPNCNQWPDGLKRFAHEKLKEAAKKHLEK